VKLLFVCVENANRSQMAEAFARMHGGARVEAFSAGSRPSGTVNPKAVAAMAEVGYDLAAHRSKSLDELPEQSYDFVVTMGCGDECPLIRGTHHEDWPLPDPKTLPPDRFATVRDEIERRVLDLLQRAGDA
jgi:protein-tyrosine-phosphatase